MPLTVITLSKVPPSLRGDLTKWMQEIATGVYVGNFNTKVREELWERVKQSAGTGEATMSYAFRNEIGYRFETHRTQRTAVDYDGIPLIRMVLNETEAAQKETRKGFSDAAKFHNARKFGSKVKPKEQTVPAYVVLDIETDGLDSKTNKILEIGAVRCEEGDTREFQMMLSYSGELPAEIRRLTGITEAELKRSGVASDTALEALVAFVGEATIVGYGVDFDLRFLNRDLQAHGLEPFRNRVIDLMRLVKKEKMYLKNYQLTTALGAYELPNDVPHRALEDARLTYELSRKVNKFRQMLK